MSSKSPGVYLSEVSYSSAIASKNKNLTVILGTATTGPTEPTEVFSQKHAELLFGPELNNDFGLTALFKIAEETDTCVYCRVCNKGSRAIFRQDSTDVFIAKEGGIHLNQCTLDAKVENNVLTLTLSDSMSVKEKVVCSLDPLSADYIVNSLDVNSQYLSLCTDDFDFASLNGCLTIVPGVAGASFAQGQEIVPESEVVFKVQSKYLGSLLNGCKVRVYTTLDNKVGLNLIKNNIIIESIPLGKSGETPQEFKDRVNMTSGFITIDTIKEIKTRELTLTGGNAGSNPQDEDYIDALKQIADPSQFQVTTLIIPGISSTKVISFAQALTLTRQDFFYIADPPMGLKSYQTVNWVDSFGLFAGGTKLTSSNVAVYSPWVLSNNFNGVEMFLPPSIIVACQMAKNDRTLNVWEACAGVVRGTLDSVNGLEYLPSQDDIKILYTNSVINPIIFIKDRGFIIWGNKTCRRPSTATSNEVTCSVNVRRLVNYLKAVIRDIAMDFVFELNDETTWDQFKLRVEPRLRAVQEARGLYKYEVIMDETTVTNEMIDALEMPGIIRLWPTRVAEVITLSFELYPMNVTFNNEGELDA